MADDEDIAANDLASGAASRARGATGAELTPDGVRPVGLHRVTMLLVCLVWPLIWVGGLVTTYDAGMAVPDWPGTYGYNLFLYPWKTWLFGPFDLLIEHGHRILGAIVGFVAIAAVILAFMTERRAWVKLLYVLLVIAIGCQGVLGGQRVLLDARSLAMVHGIFAQVVFVFSIVLAGVTGRTWWNLAQISGWVRERAESGLTPAKLLTVFAFSQLLVGAQLRHVQVTASATGFRHLVWLHLALAGIVFLVVLWLAFCLWGCGDLTLWLPTLILVGLVALQIALGSSTWVANYGWPWVFYSWQSAATHLIQSKGLFEAWVTTAHVATGSLIFAFGALQWLRLRRAIWAVH